MCCIMLADPWNVRARPSTSVVDTRARRWCMFRSIYGQCVDVVITTAFVADRSMFVCDNQLIDRFEWGWLLHVIRSPTDPGGSQHRRARGEKKRKHSLMGTRERSKRKQQKRKASSDKKNMGRTTPEQKGKKRKETRTTSPDEIDDQMMMD